MKSINYMKVSSLLHCFSMAYRGETNNFIVSCNVNCLFIILHWVPYLRLNTQFSFVWLCSFLLIEATPHVLCYGQIVANY